MYIPEKRHHPWNKGQGGKAALLLPGNPLSYSAENKLISDLSWHAEVTQTSFQGLFRQKQPNYPPATTASPQIPSHSNQVPDQVFVLADRKMLTTGHQKV